MSPFHPDLRTLARWLPRGLSSRWLVRVMKALPVPPARLPPDVSREVRALGDGVSARLIGAKHAAAPRPALLWIHGGGYVVGSAAQDDALCARFAQRLGALVVNVDYRLAPEHRFPTPLEDCYAAWQLLHREAGALGVDPSRVVIAGQSAGGGLAAALVQLLHDRGAPRPCFQLLVYPMLDDRTVLRDVDDRHHRLWNPASNRLGWESYLGRAPGSDGVPPHAAPARRPDFTGLPPAWIGVGTCDLFHDEDVEYARRLRAAGVPVELELVEGAFHGFDAVAPRNPVSQCFFEAQVAALERALR
ncbi:MAG: alpha/beta hydrolase [Myxococcota bacterium]